MNDMIDQDNSPVEYDESAAFAAFPDSPVGIASSDMLRELLSNQEYPDKMISQNPVVFTRDHTLNFYDDLSLKGMILSFDISRNYKRFCEDWFDYDFIKQKEESEARMILESKCNRGKGTSDKNSMNERKAIISHMSENRSTQTLNSSQQGGGGFLGLFKRGH